MLVWSTSSLEDLGDAVFHTLPKTVLSLAGFTGLLVAGGTWHSRWAVYSSQWRNGLRGKACFGAQEGNEASIPAPKVILVS